MDEFTPSTVPGCRTPHLWLQDGRSLYDAMRTGYTLLRRDPSIDVGALVSAAAAVGLPLKVLDVPSAAESPCEHAFVLSRPDQHVPWRGHAMPDDPRALIDLIRGA